MRTCMSCKGDLIYLGIGKNIFLNFALGSPVYYCICSECGSIEWSSVKDKCKYKWYKYDKEKLKKLFKKHEEE